MHLSREGHRWNLNLNDYELNLVIKSFDENQELSNDENDNIDRIWRNLYGIRKRLTFQQYSQNTTAVTKAVLNSKQTADAYLND